MDKKRETQQKQNFLRVEIIEQNYDPDEFTEWMDKQKQDGNKKFLNSH